MAAVAQSPAVSPPQFFRRTYLFVLTLLAGIYTVAAILVPNPWVDVPLGLLTLLFIPGYAIGALAFGARPRWPWSLTFASVVGLSVAFNVAVGLVLLYFSQGLPAPAFGFAALILLMAASFVWVLTEPAETGSRFTGFLADQLRLPNHTPAQRAVGYALLVAIVVVLVGIVILATSFPATPGNLSLGLAGPGGTASDLPVNATTGTNQSGPVYAILLLITNTNVAEKYNLTLYAFHNETVGTNGTFVPWSTPAAAIGLAKDNVRSIVSVDLNASQSFTQKVHFFFVTATGLGDWDFEFKLTNGAGTVLRTASWSMTVT